MCIVCNCDDENGFTGSAFLTAFDQASYGIKKSAEMMKKCVEKTNDKDIKKQYDKAHKKLVRLLREFNSIEHFRELHGKNL